MEKERELLKSFLYEDVTITIHRDKKVMPNHKNDWSSLNFCLKKKTAMSTIWMNKINPQLDEIGNIFETINSIIPIHPARILKTVNMQRGIVTLNSMRAQIELKNLQQEKNRRVWFCGSYASSGVPLLESGVESSLFVYENLGGTRPWTV
jgi:predicted NAD/FAD-binding protein